ncbi:hypothetical protein L210DRAFT_2277052 [Boletus edulis BED1]|uniref:Secreted protein n=1 Tax=Boletus edulis BED1 TaxID=1328754 RepID=A0AAD4BRX7_BOLED|nr:hypothetical protein L210DRAFT_2277052 [Boletus edulis BED1]
MLHKSLRLFLFQFLVHGIHHPLPRRPTYRRAKENSGKVRIKGAWCRRVRSSFWKWLFCTSSRALLRAKESDWYPLDKWAIECSVRV